DAGMNDHVSKPIDPDNLFATLLRWASPRAGAGGDKPKAQRDERAEELPAIAGVNLADGLKRVAGNTDLYRKVVGQFASRQSDAATQVAEALERGERELAERIAHTVKGVAGNLAMTEVHAAAQELEKAIRESLDSTATSLERFGSQIRIHVAAI